MGTTRMVAQAIGRKDNQSVVLIGLQSYWLSISFQSLVLYMSIDTS